MLYPGDVYRQCVYAYDKIKRLLAPRGAGLADVVKQVTYITSQNAREGIRKCRAEAFKNLPIPASTVVIISDLAVAGQLVEIDVTAAVK